MSALAINRNMVCFISSISLAGVSIMLACVNSVFDLAFVFGFFCLLVLPGYLVSRLIPKSEFTFPERLIISIGLGMSLICLLGLSYLALGVRIDRLSVLLAFAVLDGLALTLVVLETRIRGVSSSFSICLREWNGTYLVLLVLWIISVGVRLIPVAGMIVPPYHDPAVHALFAQLIVEKGTIPTSLQPYANVPMTYPLGLHLIVVFFSFATGLSIEKLLLLVTNTFNGTIVLTAYLFSAKIAQSPRVGLFSALFVGFISRFPASLYVAGKNSMIAGFLLLPIAILITYRSFSKEPRYSREYFTYLMAAAISFLGLIIIYYTAAFLYLMFVVPYAICEIVYHCSRGEPRVAKQYLIGFLVVFVVGVALSLPYVYRVIAPILKATEAATSRESYLSRSPQWISNSLTTSVNNFQLMITGQYGLLMALLSVFGAFATVVTRRKAWTMLIWFGTLVLFATPYPSQWLPIFNELTGDIMLISFFLPLCFFSGLFISESIDRLEKIQNQWLTRRRISYAAGTIKVVFIVIMILLASMSAYQIAATYYGTRAGALVKQTDYEALSWIRENTPKNATFLNNAYVWWDKQIILGSDAGSWIPAIAHRRAFFPVENLADRWPDEALKKYDVLTAAIKDPNNDETLRLLREYNVSYVYIGPRTFPIGPELDPAMFLASRNFKRVWHEDGVWIFELALGEGQGVNETSVWTQIMKGKGTPAYGAHDIQSGLSYLEFGEVESGDSGLYLFLHPKPSGRTWWNFTIDVPERNAKLVLEYGFRFGANESDGVVFSSYVNGRRLFSSYKPYTGKLLEFTYDLSEYRGKEVTLSLCVEPYLTSDWDWAVWIPRLSFG